MKTTRTLTILVLALGLTAEVANADFTFGTPTNLGPTVNSSANDGVPGISADGLELYFRSNRPGGYGGYDLWVTTRDTIDDEWGTPMNLGPTLNSSAGDSCPSISADGLSLFFMSSRPGGYGGTDMWVTTRATVSNPWGEPVNLGPTLNSSAGDGCPSISADGLSLFFRPGAPGGFGGQDLWVTTRATADDDWGPPVNLGATVNTSDTDCCPSISADGLMLFFHSNRSGGSGSLDLWVTTRATISDPWGNPVNLGPTVNSSATDHAPEISSDGSTLFFDCDRSGGNGGFDLWQVSIEPVIDLNGDGIVDCADMCIMVEHWGEDEPLCDIGPMPWGDGIVDVQDLIVLAEHLFTYPGAVAYWKLDETEGDTAYDSAGVYDGVVNGGPTWQPEGGYVNGALQFDGVDDYVGTEFVLNPADGPFSVFAWIKGGGPGQAVISQTGGVDWLLADPADGNLMTELRNIGGRTDQPPLSSQTLITDDAWHRVGFVWDGSNRTLYVDDVEVATDTQTSLAGSTGGFHIGAGKNLEPGSFFSGLIDDVRIYNRAITP